MTALRWGIIGTGGMARQFADELVAAGRTLVGFGSRSRESAEDAAGARGVRAFGSYAELVGCDQVDAVYVATPNRFHHEHGLLAIHAGRHALIEKPFAMSAGQGADLFSAAAARGVVAMEAMWTRWLPHMTRIRSLVTEGRLGDIQHVEASWWTRLPDDPAHRVRSRELGGGALLDLGVYPVAFAEDLLGEPVEVRAAVTNGPTGVDSHAAALLTFASGATATVSCGIDAAGQNRAAVIGTRARVEIDPVWSTPASARLVRHDGSVEEEIDGRVEGTGLLPEIEGMERAVRAGSAAGEAMPPTATLAVLRTLERIRAG